MTAPAGFPDLRLYLHKNDIDHAWLRTVLTEYLLQNQQTDTDVWQDHAVWEFRNSVSEFITLLQDEPEELDDNDDSD